MNLNEMMDLIATMNSISGSGATNERFILESIASLVGSHMTEDKSKEVTADARETLTKLLALVDEGNIIGLSVCAIINRPEGDGLSLLNAMNGYTPEAAFLVVKGVEHLKNVGTEIVDSQKNQIKKLFRWLRRKCLKLLPKPCNKGML